MLQGPSQFDVSSVNDAQTIILLRQLSVAIVRCFRMQQRLAFSRQPDSEKGRKMKSGGKKGKKGRGRKKTVQPNSFSKLIPAACNFKNNASGDIFVGLGSLILSFTCNFFTYFKFLSD